MIIEVMIRLASRSKSIEIEEAHAQARSHTHSATAQTHVSDEGGVVVGYGRLDQCPTTIYRSINQSRAHCCRPAPTIGLIWLISHSIRPPSCQASVGRHAHAHTHTMHMSVVSNVAFAETERDTLRACHTCMFQSRSISHPPQPTPHRSESINRIVVVMSDPTTNTNDNRSEGEPAIPPSMPTPPPPLTLPSLVPPSKPPRGTSGGSGGGGSKPPAAAAAAAASGALPTLVQEGEGSGQQPAAAGVSGGGGDARVCTLEAATGGGGWDRSGNRSVDPSVHSH